MVVIFFDIMIRLGSKMITKHFFFGHVSNLASKNLLNSPKNFLKFLDFFVKSPKKKENFS